MGGVLDKMFLLAIMFCHRTLQLGICHVQNTAVSVLIKIIRIQRSNKSVHSLFSSKMIQRLHKNLQRAYTRLHQTYSLHI